MRGSTGVTELDRVAVRDRAATIERMIAEAEEEIARARRRVAELRRRLPAEEIADYALASPDGEALRASAAFGEKEELIVIHNMGRTCAMCTLWADGFNGILPHIQDRAAFVVVSPDPPEMQANFARQRGWGFRMLSSRGSTFTGDLGFEDAAGSPLPGVSVLRREPEGRIVRISRAWFGPGDEYCPAYHLFGLLGGGEDGWQPKLRYR